MAAGEEELRDTGASRRDAIFRAIFESSAVGFALVDAEGEILRANRALEEILGYEPDGLTGVRARDITPPDDADDLRANMSELVSGRAADYRVERRYYRKDGAVIWARVSVTAIPPTPGSAAVAVAIIEDVTLARAAEESLASQNEDLERLATSLRAVLDATVDGILLTDREGEVQLANRPMVRLGKELGLPLEGTAVDRLLSVEHRMTDPVGYREAMERLRDTPDEPSMDEFELADSRRVFQGFTSPVHIDSGVFVGRIWTLREVTQQRELDRMKDDFVATVSHELRTPLTSMMGFLEMLREGEAGPLTAEQDRFLSIVYRSSERLQRLVGDLLFVARLDASGLQLEFDDVRLGDVVADAVETVAALARSREIDLRLDAPPDGGLVVWGDRERLAQLVANLLSNALKFTSAGGWVAARTFADRGIAVLEVEDTGIGIPVAEQERLFQRFFRSSNATQQAIPGTGLGLVITKAIAEAHGGRVSVASVPGASTCFRVELPLR
jgi:two-component system phosphate regulon sensor histidine kinase PhoR